MHVGHVVLGLDIGGLETVVANLLRAAPLSHIKQTVICLDRPGVMSADLERSGATVRVLRRREPLDPLLPHRLASLARRDNVDVLHAHNFTPFFYSTLARLTAQRLGVVATFHNTRIGDAGLKRRAALRLLAPRDGAIVGVSNQTSTILQSIVGKSTQVSCVANGVDVARFQRVSSDRDALRAELEIPAGGRIIGSVGRLSPENDYATLIGAFVNVLHAHGSTYLVLAGAGPELNHLQNEAKRHGVGSRVFFIGPRSDVSRVLSALDVFVLSSLTEGTSMALLEAMAAGVPIVATAVGGTTDLIRNEVHGLLVPSQNPDELARAISRVLGERALSVALAAAAATLVRERYSLEAMGDAYLRLYQAAR